MEIHTLHEFMLHTKNITYLLMGATLVGVVCYWLVLTGRDKKIRKY